MEKFSKALVLIWFLIGTVAVFMDKIDIGMVLYLISIIIYIEILDDKVDKLKIKK